MGNMWPYSAPPIDATDRCRPFNKDATEIFISKQLVIPLALMLTSLQSASEINICRSSKSHNSHPTEVHPLTWLKVQNCILQELYNESCWSWYCVSHHQGFVDLYEYQGWIIWMPAQQNYFLLSGELDVSDSKQKLIKVNLLVQNDN